MPRGDTRGPNRMGPMTGRAAGFCSGSNTPGFANTGGYGQDRGAGRGFVGGFHGAATGAGYGRGMGRRSGIGSQPAYTAPGFSKESEKGFIENEVSFLKDQLKALEGRLAEMQEDE